MRHFPVFREIQRFHIVKQLKSVPHQVTHRPMNEEKVKILQSQILQTAIHSFHNGRLAVESVPNLKVKDS